MPLIKKILYTSLLVLLISISQAFAGDLKKVGKFKDWEVIVISEADSKVCFAQSIPVLQAPKKNKRDARLFVTFRPNEKISNEISATAGYEFNKNNSVLATSGNNKFKFDIKQQGFAWMTSNKKEKISKEEALRDAKFVSDQGQDEDREAARAIQETLSTKANKHLTFGHFEKAIVNFHSHLAKHLGN